MVSSTEYDRFTFPVSIGGRRYLADMSGYRHHFLPWRRQATDQGAEPGLSTLDVYGPWRRTQSDWTLGAGQDVFDGPTSSRRRYAGGWGLDPFRRDGRLGLSGGDFTLAQTITPGSGSAATRGTLEVVGGHVWAGHGDRVFRRQTASGATWSEVTGLLVDSDVKNLAYDGNDVYAAVGSDGVYSSADDGSGFTQFSTELATNIFYVNGRLLIASAGDIVELDSGGAVAQTVTLPTAGGIRNMIDTPYGIFLSRGKEAGQIQRLPIASDGTLGTPTTAAVLPTGEEVFGIQSTANIVMMSTSRGVRVATISGGGTIEYGPVVTLRQPWRDNDEVNHQVDMSKGARGQPFIFEDKAYFLAGDIQTDPPDATATSDNLVVGVASLKEFTSPLAPPVAFLPVTTSSTATIDHVVFERSGAVSGLVAMSGGEIYEQLDQDPPTGYMLSGWVTLGVPEDKIATLVDVRHNPLNSGDAVDVYIEESDGTITTAGTSDTDGATGPADPFTVSGVGPTERFRVWLKLTPGSGSSGPVVRRLSVRAMPVPIRTQRFTVPIVLKEMVQTEDGDGQDVTQDPRAEWDHLEGLVESRTPVTYIEGDTSYTVVVDGLDMPEDDDRDWTDRKDFPEGVAVVTLLTV